MDIHGTTPDHIELIVPVIKWAAFFIVSNLLI